MEDYNNIKEIIHDIIGIDTKQGRILKTVIKNYFENKPIKSPITNKIVKQESIEDIRVAKIIQGSKNAMEKFSVKLSKSNRRNNDKTKCKKKTYK